MCNVGLEVPGSFALVPSDIKVMTEFAHGHSYFVDRSDSIGVLQAFVVVELQPRE